MISHNQRLTKVHATAKKLIADSLIQFLTGQRVIRTTLDKRDAYGTLIGVDDNAICIYEMSGRAFGTMTASWTYYGAEDNSILT